MEADLAFSFGDTAELADELALLVIERKKTATCWAADDPPVATPAVGNHSVVLDSAGNAVALIETLSLEPKKFNEVDADFAFAEGEGDRSLETWRRDHERYFTRTSTFSESMLLVCERFELIEVLPGAARLLEMRET